MYDELVQNVDAKIYANRCLIISNLTLMFPEVLCTILYEIVTERLCYQKVIKSCMPKMLRGAQR